MKQLLDLDRVIISWKPELYSNQQFLQAAQKQQLKVQVFNPQELTLLAADLPKNLPCYLRLGSYRYKESLKTLQKQQLHFINSLPGFSFYRNKVLTYQHWSKLNIPIPLTFIMDLENSQILSLNNDILRGFDPHNLQELYSLICQLLSNENKTVRKFILKFPEDLKGQGVFLITTTKDLTSALYANRLTPLPNKIIIQNYFAESHGQDVRVLYIGKRKFAIERKNLGDFRSNLAQGGLAQKTHLLKHEELLCDFVFQKSNLNYAGIDFIRTSEGIKFLEINVSPGFQGIDSTYQENIAEFILELN